MDNTQGVPTESSNRKVIRVSRKKLTIWIVVLIVVAFLAYAGFKILTQTFGTNSDRYSQGSVQIPCIPGAGVDCGGGSSKNYNNSANTGRSSVDDTREFMKVGYRADLKTRKVEDVMHDVKSEIELAEGRIDNLNESTKYSQVTFVIPKSNFETFKEEVEALTHKKLYTHTTTSQNLLDQKQSIEERASNASNTLSQLQAKQQTQTNAHNKKIADLQAQLKETQRDLATTRANYAATPSNDLKAQETILAKSETSIQQQIALENSNYAYLNQSTQNEINSANTNLASIGKQDVLFTDNIETVNGFISVTWINTWDLLKVFSPVHPTIIIIILVIILWLCIRRKNYVPKVEFV